MPFSVAPLLCDHTAAKPHLLFVTPVLPAPTGGGSAMRAFGWIATLERHYHVHTLVIRRLRRGVKAGLDSAPYPNPITIVTLGPSDKKQLLLGLAAPYLLPRFPSLAMNWVPWTTALEKEINEQIAGVQFERIIVYKMALHEVGQALASHQPSGIHLELDLDDIESQTCLSIARRALQRQEIIPALRWLLEYLGNRNLERLIIPSYRRIFVAAPEDAASLRVTYPAVDIQTFPNLLAAAPGTIRPPAQKTFHMLFTGLLNYYPNMDAVRFLIDNAAPHFQKAFNHRWQMTIIGQHASSRLIRHIQNVNEVALISPAPLTQPYYDRAHAVLAPLFAGGGTKFKVLEAFLAGRPLIAAPHAMRGLPAIPGLHYLPAQTASEFAAAAAALAADRDLWLHLAQNAQHLALESYHTSMKDCEKLAFL